MRTEEELAILALTDVLILWLIGIFSLLTIFQELPTDLLNKLLFSVFALAFLPATALALSIRHFRKERKEKELRD